MSRPAIPVQESVAPCLNRIGRSRHSLARRTRNMTRELLSSAGFLVVTPLAAVPGGLAKFFATTGFIGPLMLLCAVRAAFIALRRAFELRPGSLAPLALQRELETHVRDAALVLDKAASSRSLLGALVTGGMILRRAGLDE